MATSRIDRSDDTAAVLKIIATVNGTEDAVTKEWQAVTISDSTNPVANKLAIDASGHLQADIAAASVAVPVTDNAGSLTVDNAALSVTGGGVEATALRVTVASDSTGVLSIDDNSGSLTIDNAALSVTGGGVEATALRVTLASDSTGVLSIDDNAGSLTIDGTVDTELTTADLDTGAGTDTRAVVGLVGSASGGGQIIPGSSTDGLLVNLGANNDVTLASTTITGTVAVTQSGTWDEVGINDSGNAITVDWAGTAPPIGAGLEATALRVTLATDSTGLVSVDDNSGSLTVDNAALSVTGGGVEAAALRVTLASDSTGLISVDDNSGSLTVDGVTRTEYTVDAAAPAAPVGTTVVAERDDQLAALTEIEGDWTNLRASSKGALWVTIPDTNGDPITSFGGGTQYTEDAAAAADPVGTVVNLIRKDAPAAVTSTDGDNIAQRGTNYGAAYVQVVSSGGALIDTFGGSGGTAQADESAFTEGTTVMTPVGGVLNDTIVSDPTEDQAAAVRITAKRAFHTNLRKADGTEITSGGGVEANALRVTLASDSTGLVSVDDNGGAITVDWAGTAPPIGAGVEATALRVTLATDSTGLVSVDDNAGSLTVDGTVTANLSATDNAVLDAIEVDTTTLAGAVAGTEMQVDVVAALPTGTNTIGNVGTLPLTAGGCSMYHKVSAATDNAANIKASAGQVYGITIYNNAGYPVYVKLHNTAGVPTAGAGVVRAFGCQAGTQTTYPITHGAAFGTGIGITIIKDITDAGTTATAASDCVVGVEYK